jgi:hypothetical protein
MSKAAARAGETEEREVLGLDFTPVSMTARRSREKIGLAWLLSKLFARLQTVTAGKLLRRDPLFAFELYFKHF